ncbi:right-handed parallel beta-helix repeat-containing protein [Candidatus Saccharibacteria bacterium]|nr:right-handed parallel beta-helix repeat-containing protein [Candidatus Saccharibacteria bacterium]
MVGITRRKILKILAIVVSVIIVGVIALVAYVLTFNHPKTVTLKTVNGTITETQVAGLQLTSQTWKDQVRVTGDVTFAPIATLTIEPGTKVIFDKQPDIAGTDWAGNADAYIKDHNDPTGRKGYSQTHFSITAKIIAKGTPDKKITFTSAQSKSEYADWDQLTLLGGSRLEYVEAAYAHNGLTVWGGNVQITHSMIHDSLWSCVDVFSQNVLVEDNQIYYCWHQAIGTKKAGVPATIRRNFIHDAQVGVNCENGSKPTIVDNKLVAAPIGEECGSGSSNEVIDQPADTAGGTYAGQLIYPSNKP